MTLGKLRGFGDSVGFEDASGGDLVSLAASFGFDYKLKKKIISKNILKNSKKNPKNSKNIPKNSKNNLKNSKNNPKNSKNILKNSKKNPKILKIFSKII